MDAALVAAWGRTLAAIHAASERFEPGSGARRPAWDESLRLAAAWLPAEERDAHRLLAEALDWLCGLPVAPGDYGLIHYDLEPDNLIWDGQRLHVIDFDDAAYWWFAADVAFAFDHLLDDLPEQAGAIQAAFLAGYRSVRALDAGWEKTFPAFNRLLKGLKFARVVHAYRSADPALDPPWLARMRARHSAWLDEMRCTFAVPFSWGRI